MYAQLTTDKDLAAIGITPSVVAALYDRAARLERAWQSAGLADDFDSRMVEATLSYLARVGSRRFDGTLRTPREQARFASMMLVRFWYQNAKRDAARLVERQASGAAMRAPRDLSQLEDGATCASLHTVLGDDPNAGETGRDVANFLKTELGWPCERAWAFVLAYSARDYDDASFLLAQRFEKNIAPATLRQWMRRYFIPARPRVFAFLFGRTGPLGGPQ